MEKINIAEILKSCPKGMELDCTMFIHPVTLNMVVDDSEFPIVIETAKGDFVTLTEYGNYAETEEAKCVIFPKGKTTWEGFVPPCQFKDGDIIVDSFGGIHIMQNSTTSYCYFDRLGILDKTKTTCVRVERLATEEEKQKLFDAIKANGYKWNEATKTLEKLIEPKFKVGDRVRNKNYKDYIYDIHDIIDKGYRAKGINADSPILILFGSQEDNYELVPNKFDINTLVPFESRVLVRAADNQFWRPAIWGVKQEDWDFCCVLGGEMWEQCIPYEGNEHLRGIADDCDEYYKYW